MDVILFSDGGSRGNPGPAACGIIIKVNGVQQSFGYYLGELTNNQAEYLGLQLGLIQLQRIVKNLSVNKVIICMDSELVIRQMTGNYKVRDGKLQPIFRQISKLIGQLPMVQFNHIPRGQNEAADQMVNDTLDAIYGLKNTTESTYPKP